jgi:hypothetical protein
VDEDSAADVAAIVAMKHAYFRLLDTKAFDELGRLFTEDATCAFQSGELTFEGPDAFVAFLHRELGGPGIVTMHHGHHPEITVVSPTQATGTWYLEDRVIVDGQDFEIHGTALYDDEYRKDGGRWRISRTGYRRVFEEHRRRRTGEVLSFRTMFDAT